eukprot:6915836-Pyramimonas_sp.AAC.1
MRVVRGRPGCNPFIHVCECEGILDRAIFKLPHLGGEPVRHLTTDAPRGPRARHAVSAGAPEPEGRRQPVERRLLSNFFRQ